MITIKIKTDNAAFECGDLESESARIIRVAAQLIENGQESGALLDINGNTVGRFVVSA